MTKIIETVEQPYPRYYWCETPAAKLPATGEEDNRWLRPTQMYRVLRAGAHPYVGRFTRDRSALFWSESELLEHGYRVVTA